MNIQVTARHFHASPQLHQNLKVDLEKLTKFNSSIIDAHVILEEGKGSIRRAEVIVKIFDKSICAQAEENTMGKAIESMMEKIERQLKKENEKLKLHKATSLSENAIATFSTLSETANP